MSGRCRPIRSALGVYVLGAIEPAERATVEEHLADCPDCREELAGLAGLPALLRRVPLAEAERLASGGQGLPAAGDEPGDLLLSRLLARVASVRRARWRRAVAAGVVVAAVALGGGVAAGLISGHSRGAPTAATTGTPAAGASGWQTATGADPRTGVTLTVRYAPAAWGTTMSVQASGVRAGTVCRFLVTDSAGRHWAVGGWQVAYGGAATWYPASTFLPQSRLRGFELLAGSTVLARATVG